MLEKPQAVLPKPVSIATPHRPSPAGLPGPGARPGGGPPGASRPPRPSGGGAFTTSIDPVRVLRRHFWLLVLAGFVGTGIGVGAFVYLDRHHPIYRGEVLFEVRPGLDSPQQIGTPEIPREDVVTRMANTEAALLLSRVVLTRAVTHHEILQTHWGRKFALPGGGIATEDAVDDLLENCTASMMRGTNLFRLTWRARHASDVPVVLNRIRDEYIERRRELDDADTTQNIDVFRREATRTQQRIQEVENEIAALIRQHGLQGLGDTRYHQRAIQATQITEQIGSTSSALQMAEVSLQQTEAKLRGTLEPDSEERLMAEMDPVVRHHAQLLAELRTQRRELLEKWTPEHAGITQIDRQIRVRELERDAKLEEVIRRHLEAEHKELRDRVEQYRSLLTELQREADEVDMQLRELTAHQAQLQSLEQQRNRLDMQLTRERETLDAITLIRARADAARVRALQPAELPRQKHFPRMEVVVPLGALATLFLTLGIVFLRELTDQRIKSASDLAVVPSAKILGVIPDLEDDPTSERTQRAELIVRHHPLSVISESYRQACVAMMRGIENGAHQTVLFTSGLPGAGTTTAISNVASSMTATGKRVLVVDANFRRPHLAEAMGVRADGPGLGDLLAEAATIDEAIVQAECGVSVIPVGTPANRVFERLNNGTFESIVAELRGRFDMIFFDSPPAIVAGDAMVLANRLDSAILVVRANQEQKGLVARLVGQLSDARCDALGVLLNRARETAGGYFKKNYATMAKYSRK